MPLWFLDYGSSWLTVMNFVWEFDSTVHINLQVRRARKTSRNWTETVFQRTLMRYVKHVTVALPKIVSTEDVYNVHHRNLHMFEGDLLLLKTTLRMLLGEGVVDRFDCFYEGKGFSGEYCSCCAELDYNKNYEMI